MKYTMLNKFAGLFVVSVCLFAQPPAKKTPEKNTAQVVQEQLNKASSTLRSTKPRRRSLSETQPIFTGTITSNPYDTDIALPMSGIIAVQEAHSFIFDGPTPNIDDRGWVRYVYGHSYPIVVVTPHEISAVLLDENEYILPGTSTISNANPEIQVEPYLFGPTNRTVILIKTPRAGIEGDVAIMTNKRYYQLHVMAKPHDYTPRIAFTYPDDDSQKTAEFLQQVAESENLKTKQDQEEKRKSQLKELEIATTPINTEYKIKTHGRGAEYMRPVSVWNDEERTHVKFLPNVAVRNLPIPKVYTATGAEDSPNFRYNGPELVIDGIFDKIVLRSGVGRKRQDVTIKNLNPMLKGSQ